MQAFQPQDSVPSGMGWLEQRSTALMTLTRWHLLTHRHQKNSFKISTPPPRATLHPFPITMKPEMLRFLHDELAPNTRHMGRKKLPPSFQASSQWFRLCSPEFFLGSGLKIYLGMKARVGPLKPSTGGGVPPGWGCIRHCQCLIFPDK